MKKMFVLLIGFAATLAATYYTTQSSARHRPARSSAIRE